jgi:hypothetical protein
MIASSPSHALPVSEVEIREHPTPESIEKQTAAIRKQWSQKTRLRRSGRPEHLMAVFEMTSLPRRKGFKVE